MAASIALQPQVVSSAVKPLPAVGATVPLFIAANPTMISFVPVVAMPGVVTDVPVMFDTEAEVSSGLAARFAISMAMIVDSPPGLLRLQVIVRAAFDCAM